MNTYLKTLRQKRNLNQDFLAKKLNVSRPTYAQIENGSRKMLVEEAQILAELFELSIEDFLAKKETLPHKVELATSTKPKRKKQEEIRISVPQERVEKFKETLLYILEQIGARPNVGAAVICKLMYFIDFDFYEKFEEQLIGAKYIKNHFGPTPIAFQQIVEQMEKDGDLVSVLKKYFQHDQQKYLPRRKADLSEFSAREKELIDWEIERFKDFNASKMRNYSHKDVPWIGTDDQKIINYESVFARTEEFSVRQYDNEV